MRRRAFLSGRLYPPTRWFQTSRSIYLSARKKAQQYEDIKVRPDPKSGQMTPAQLELQACVTQIAETYKTIAQCEQRRLSLQEQVIKEMLQTEDGLPAKDIFVTSGKDRANITKCVSAAVQVAAKKLLVDPASRDVVMSFDSISMNMTTGEVKYDDNSVDPRSLRSKPVQEPAAKPDTSMFRSIYAFVLTPIKPQFKGFPINVHFCDPDQQENDIVFMAELLLAQLAAARVNVAAVCHGTAQTQVEAFSKKYFEFIKDKMIFNHQAKSLIEFMDDYKKKTPVCLMDPLNILKRIRAALLEGKKVLSGSSEAIDKHCILTAESIAKAQDSPKITYSQHQALKTADMLAMLLLDPTNAEAMDVRTYSHHVVVKILASGLFAPYLKGDCQDILVMLDVSRKCLLEHFRTEEAYAPTVLQVNEKNQGEEPLARLFSPELMQDMICYLTSVYYILLKHRQVSGLALTSSPVEVYFDHLKDQAKITNNAVHLVAVTRNYITERLLYADTPDDEQRDKYRYNYWHTFSISDKVTMRNLPYSVSPYVELYSAFIDPSKARPANKAKSNMEYLAQAQAPYLEMLGKLELCCELPPDKEETSDDKPRAKSRKAVQRKAGGGADQ